MISISNVVLLVLGLYVIATIGMSLYNWFCKANYKWDECPVCGKSLYMHRERHPATSELIWRGNCDYCYNQVIEYINKK